MATPAQLGKADDVIQAAIRKAHSEVEEQETKEQDNVGNATENANLEVLIEGYIDEQNRE